jgi:hypothetical protein
VSDRIHSRFPSAGRFPAASMGEPIQPLQHEKGRTQPQANPFTHSRFEDKRPKAAVTLLAEAPQVTAPLIKAQAVQATNPAAGKPAPAALSEKQMLAEAESFLAAQGHTLKGTQEEKTAQMRTLLQKDTGLRRDFLHAQGTAERKTGKQGLEIFSNAVQRARWIHQTGSSSNPGINGEEAGSDIGMLFAGTASLSDGPFGRRDHQWNLNHPKALPPSGFRTDRLNDDGASSADQTHHLAYYMMVGATNDSLLGEFAGNLGGTVSDWGNPQDQALAYDGVGMGRQLNDPNIDVNALIWSTVGDASQTAPGNTVNTGSNSGSGSGSDGSDSSSGW